MSKAFTLCCTLDEAKAIREEVAFMQAVKVMALPVVVGVALLLTVVVVGMSRTVTVPVPEK